MGRKESKERQENMGVEKKVRKGRRTWGKKTVRKGRRTWGRKDSKERQENMG